jgi:hypothetical protein
MEIHINEGEKLTIYAKSPGGETFDYLEMAIIEDGVVS